MEKYKIAFVACVVILGSLSLYTIPAFGQISPIEVEKYQWADLVITEFTVTQPGQQKGDFMEYQYRAKIKNTGGADVDNYFFLTIQKKTETESDFNMTDNHRKIIHLGAGITMTVDAKFKLNVADVSGKTVEVRAWLDSGGDKEFPPAYCDVRETDENNNYSDVVAITGGYSPNVVKINPQQPINRIIVFRDVQASNQKVSISGVGFGKTQGQHGVAIFPVEQLSPTKVDIQSWSNGIIYFTIPASVEAGDYTIAIVDTSTMQAQSNRFPVHINHQARVAWEEFITTWELGKGAVSLRIHTWNGDHHYNNQSTLKIITKIDTMDVEMIQFPVTAVGDYRYLIKDFNSAAGGVTLSKFTLRGQKLPQNQLRMQILFESEGLEVKGYFHSVAGGGWKDHGAPDIDIDDAMLSFCFVFTFTNGTLDYIVPKGALVFKGDVDARKDADDFFMDLFVQGWDREVKDRVRNSVRNSLMTTETRQSITSSLMEFVINQSKGLEKESIIQNIEFKNDNIIVTFH